MASKSVTILLNAIDKASPVFGKVGGNVVSFAKVGTAAFLAVGTAAAAAGTAIAAGLLKAADHFSEVGSALNDMRARTGVSAQALAEFGHAANQTGSSIEDVETSIKKMQKTVGDAANGSKAATAVLARLGLTLGEIQRLSPDRQFQIIADRIHVIPSAAGRAATAMAIFGKSGTSLLPMIENLSELRAEAHQLGLVLSDEQVAAADALGDAMDKAKAAVGGVVLQIGAAMAPAITTAANNFAGLASTLSTTLAPAAAEIGGLLADIIAKMSTPAGGFSLAAAFGGELKMMAADARTFLADWDTGWELFWQVQHQRFIQFAQDAIGDALFDPLGIASALGVNQPRAAGRAITDRLGAGRRKDMQAETDALGRQLDQTGRTFRAGQIPVAPPTPTIYQRPTGPIGSTIQRVQADAQAQFQKFQEQTRREIGNLQREQLEQMKRIAQSTQQSQQTLDRIQKNPTRVTRRTR